MYDSSTIKEKLKEKGYRLTNQRKNLIEVLCKNPDYLFSLDDIYDSIKSEYKNTTYSTVYRNLEVLKQAGIIKKVTTGKKAVKYKLVCSKEHHHHIICKHCGKVATIDFCPAQYMHESLEAHGFTVTDHVFEVYGCCSKCLENLSK